MLIGREPDAAVLGEASAWQLARSVVAAATDPRLVDLDASLDRVTGGGALAQPCARRERRRQSRRAGAWRATSCRCEGLPIEAPRKRTDFASFVDALGVVDALPPLLDLADAYAAAKRQRGYVEFSDQIALALADLRAASRGRGRPPRAVSHRAARRVPGHERRADPIALDAVRRPAGDGGRRPRPVDLRLARRERREPRALRP